MPVTETNTYKDIAAYDSGTQYYEYDIVTYNGDKWWAKKSVLNLTPSEGASWTQKWFFIPTYSQGVSRQPKKLRAQFGEGYSQCVGIGLDFDKNLEFQLSWENVPDREAKGVIEFARDQNAFANTTTVVSDEAQSGFWYQPPFPYASYAGLYVVNSFEITFSSYNKNSFTVNLKLKNLQASP